MRHVSLHVVFQFLFVIRDRQFPQRDQNFALRPGECFCEPMRSDNPAWLVSVPSFSDFLKSASQPIKTMRHHRASTVSDTNAEL